MHSVTDEGATANHLITVTVRAKPSHKTLPLLDEQKVGMDSSNASLKTLNVDQVRSMNCWHATLASG